MEKADIVDAIQDGLLGAPAEKCNYRRGVAMRSEVRVGTYTYAVYLALEDGQEIDDPDVYSIGNICGISRL